MAEGFLRQELGEAVEIFSAGTHPSRVAPLALTVMQEVGIDISHHYAKTIAELPYQEWDYVITVCDKARETCPFIPARHNRHYSFPDPSVENTLEAFRRVRDEIQVWARAFARELRQLHL